MTPESSPSLARGEGGNEANLLQAYGTPSPRKVRRGPSEMANPRNLGTSVSLSIDAEMTIHNRVDHTHSIGNTNQRLVLVVAVYRKQLPVRCHLSNAGP